MLSKAWIGSHDRGVWLRRREAERVPQGASINSKDSTPAAASSQREGTRGEDPDLLFEEATLVSFQRIYPIPLKGKQYDYAAYIEYAYEVEDKLLKGGPSVQVSHRAPELCNVFPLTAARHVPLRVETAESQEAGVRAPSHGRSGRPGA